MTKVLGFLSHLMLFLLVSCVGDAIENTEKRQEIADAAISAPFISSVSPANDGLAGGGTLTITGIRLDGTSVTVGGANCPIITQSGSILTCTIPAGSVGGADIVIINSSLESDLDNTSFTYVTAPTVSAINISVGSDLGGDSVMITGTDFYNVTDIQIGGTSCTSIVQTLSTVATCTTAATTAGGPFNVVVTNGDVAAQTGTGLSLFTYETPPSITSLDLTSLYEAGAQTLTITGTDFISPPVVTIDGNICTAVSYNATTIVCTTPVGVGTGVDVVVANPSGISDTTTTNYTPVPTISSIDLNYGLLAGGDLITITGTNFTSGGSFDISAAGVPCTTPTFLSATSVTCLTAAGAAIGVVVVTNNDGQTASSATNFTYRAAPGLTLVAPIEGATGGGTNITLTGSGFDLANISVSIDGDPCTNIVVGSATSLTCDTPAHAAGLVDIIVTNTEDNQSSVALANSYTFNLPPSLASLSVNYGPVAGTNTISFLGTDFSAGAIASIDGFNCISSTVIIAAQVDCVVPAHAAGLVNIAITNADGQSVSLNSAYTYTPAPTVTAVSPEAGPTTGGQTITLTGTAFFPGLAITVNSVACTTSTYISFTSATCVTPAGAGGPFTVEVTNTDAQVGNLVTSYEYIAPPTVTSMAPTIGNGAGGDVITVTGTDFYVAGGVSATINGVSCTGITSLTATSFDCTTGNNGGLGGPFTMTVTNTVDGQTGTGGAFEFIAPPTISDIKESTATDSIDGGTLNGGNTIRIEGGNFQVGVAAFIGTATCTITRIDANNLDCVLSAGPHALGATDLVVTNIDAQSAISVGAYTFRTPPTITGYDSPVGPIAGGNTLTITGTDFVDGDDFAISIGGTPCTLSTFLTTTSATCDVPAGILGAAAVLVFNDDYQSVTDGTGYTYVADPTIVSFAPTTIYEVGSQSLIITGTDFYAGATVTVDGNDCTPLVVDSATQITCTTPPADSAGIGTVTVEVTSLAGQTGTNTIDYTPAPTITGYDYAYGPAIGGNTITIAGTGFVAAGSFGISIDGTPCTTSTHVSAISATCVVPVGTGTVDIVLTNNDGQTVTDPGAFNYVPGPTLTSFSPTTIHAVGSQTLVITGTDFQADTVITIDGNLCSTLTYDSATQLTCVTPVGSAGSVNVIATNSDTQTDTTTITYVDAPTIASFNPTTITEVGSESLVITGTGFLASATVTIDGNACTPLTVDSLTQITCTTPPADSTGVGTVTVEVTNTDSQTGTNTIDYLPVPTITSYDYAYGPAAGGNTIVITGTGFVTGGSFDIAIDGTPCTTAAFLTATTASCVVPAGALGAVDVLLTNFDGQTVTDLGAFEYVAAPTLVSFNPTSIHAAGGQSLVITGTGFQADSAITIDGNACTTLVYNSATQLTCTTPVGSAGTVNVIVTNSDTQTDTTTIDYVNAPTISSFNLATIMEIGSQSLVITGTGFLAGASVTVGGNPCVPLTVDSLTQITCTTPSGSGASSSIVVANTDGQTATSSLDYKPKPVITSVTTTDGAYGSSGGGDTVTISGSGFYDDIGSPTITIGAASCTAPTIVSTSTITCTSGVNAAGLVSITITNADTQTDTLVGGFTYTNLPTFISVLPVSGSIAGGTVLVITGTNFTADTAVDIGGSTCLSLSFDSVSQITCTSPSGSSGSVAIDIDNPGRPTVSTAAAYTYLNNGPSITSISPQGGAITGGTAVTITGTDFDPTITDGDVVIGGINCTGVSAAATSITCTTGNHITAGFGDVVVTNSDAQADTLATGYLYAQGPTLTSISPTSGSTAGGTTITLTGTDFAASAVITVGGVSCGSAVYTSATTMSCVTPVGTTGAADVVVTQFFQSSTLAGGFTYSAGATLAWQVGAGAPNPPNPADYADPGADLGMVFTLQNTGVVTSSTISLSLSGTNSTVWTLLSDNCSGTTLAAGASCTVNAYFQWSLLPDGPTVYSATLEATAATGGTTTNALQGQNL